MGRGQNRFEKGFLTELTRMGCEPGHTAAVMSKLHRGTALDRLRRMDLVQHDIYVVWFQKMRCRAEGAYGEDRHVATMASLTWFDFSLGIEPLPNANTPQND